MNKKGEMIIVAVINDSHGPVSSVYREYGYASEKIGRVFSLSFLILTWFWYHESAWLLSS